MNEQSTSDPQTGMDRVFSSLRGIGIRRRTDDRWVAGVCSGIADRLGIDPVIVRAALVLLSLLGAGIAFYLVAWALLPDDHDEILAQRALRDGAGGPIVLLVLAGLAVVGAPFSGPWWSHQSGWGFPWGLVFIGLLIWWLVTRSGSNPDAYHHGQAQQVGTPTATLPSPAAAAPWPAASGPSSAAAGPVVPGTPAVPPNVPRSPVPTVPRPPVPKKRGRRSGGPLLALIAIGLALATYGSMIWAANAFSWTGDHRATALAGALAAIGLLMVVLGVAGWRAGFATFLAVVLALASWSVMVVPSGIHLGGRIGDATWAPSSVSSNASYRIGIGQGVLDLSALPRDGLSEARIPASVGIGDLKVIVPEDLTVRIVGHVGLGEILLPGDLQNVAGNGGKGGTDVSRSVDVGDGPTEVVVDAEVGVGQLTVVKE
ncbi:MAG TPA: PspC domain-containing protein [Dermatophilaceae bacterium]